MTFELCRCSNSSGLTAACAGVWSGAQAAGCDSVFVAGGIHARDLGGGAPGKNSVMQEDDLGVLCSQQGAQPTYAIPFFQP